MPTTLQKHTITAFFETRADADRAAEKLRASGVPASDVTVSPDTAQGEYGVYGDDRTASDAPRKSGFWASLEEMFGGTDDHHTYAEGVRRGHVLLTAQVADAHLDNAIAILEEHGSIDLDEREETWRGEGWTGAPGTYSSSAAATGATAGGAMGMALAGTAASKRDVETGTFDERAVLAQKPVVAQAPVAKAPALDTSNPLPATGKVGRGGEDVVQVVEERLNVGKRAVSRGKVRLHSYVVENQISENVTLRDETVTVDRRAVDRPVASLAADAFQDRTIEMEEVDEEAVVGKSARVVEEIGIRKEVADRVETVRDTVRSTKVDIEDSRTVGATATGASFMSRLVKDVEVVGSDGVHVGIVDRIDGAMMKLKRKDSAADGQHHLLPTDLVKSVDGKAMLSIAAAEAMRRWKAV